MLIRDHTFLVHSDDVDRLSLKPLVFLMIENGELPILTLVTLHYVLLDLNIRFTREHLDLSLLVKLLYGDFLPRLESQELLGDRLVILIVL